MATKSEKCWKPNSKCERNLLIALCVFLAVSVILTITLIVVSTSGDEICNSKECIKASFEFLTNMDTNADPCEDFYQYACGNYADITNSLVSPSSSKFEEKRMRNKEKLRKIINQPWKRGEPKYYKLVKDLHSSCLNESNIEDLGASPIYSILNTVGGWPVVEGSDWKENKFDWKRSIIEFRSMGVNFNFFFHLSVYPDFMDSTTHTLYLEEHGTSLPRDYYRKKRYRDGYLKLMTEVAVTMGADRTRAEREMKETLEFEAKLAQLKTPKEEYRNISKFHNEFKIYELQTLMNEISWVDFLNGMDFSYEISRYDKIIVGVPNALKQVSVLLSNTNKRTISNYVLLRIVLSHCDLVHKTLASLCIKFSEQYFGIVPLSNRKHYCINKVINSMRIATGAIYAKNHFNPEAKKLATELVNDVKYVMKQSLSNTEWMDAQTLSTAVEKLESMQELVAYPEELLDDYKINKFYSALRINEDEFFKNLLRLSKFSTDFYFSQLNKPVDETSWMRFASSGTVNAANLFSANRIQIYAGILGGSFFNAEWPKYLNYGGIGSIIGHEFVHGFDDVGKQFDKNGNVNDWWAKETAEKFRKKADKIVQQYSSFEDPEVNMTLNGINVQGEAISDIEGVNFAYKAYEKWLDENKKEFGLPGLSLNPRQLFWLKAANVWCSAVPEEFLINQILNGNHPPSRYRVIGPVINSKYFSKDFNCPLGSPMNPKEKISFW